MSDFHLRSQVERLTIVDTLLDGIWEEVQMGCIQDGILQIAVYAQTNCNRIVWKLNQINNGGHYEQDH